MTKNFSSIGRRLLTAVGLGVTLCLVDPGTAGAFLLSREAAVDLARQGDTTTAIRQLRALLRESDDQQTQFDLMTILDWDGQTAEVIGVWRTMGAPVQLPDYVRVALVDALIETEQWKDAQRVVAYWLEGEPNSVDALFFQGQVLQATGNRLGALRYYQRAQQLAPDNQKIRFRQLAILTDLGAVSAAARLVESPSPDTQASLAAQQVRWGLEVPPSSSRQIYARLDAAIERLQRLIVQTQSNHPDDRLLLRRLHADLAIALSDRQDFRGVIEQLQYLEATGGIPAYVQAVQGNALLALREPEQAKAVFEAMLAEQPNNQQAQQGLLGTLTVLGDWTKAYALVDGLEPQQTLRLSRSPVPYANEAWLDARLQSILVRSWAGQNDEAWSMMTPLLAGAPAEPDVQITVATLAAARGLPRLGEHHAGVSYTLAPKAKESRLALGRAQMSRAQWEKAKASLTTLQADYPSDGEVAEFAKDLRVQDMYEWVTDLQGENEAGQSFYAPGDGYQTSTYLFSPRIDNRWRLYSAATAARARSPGVFNAKRQQIGLGALIQWPDVELDASVWQNFGAVDKTSVSVTGAWSPTDHWQFEAGYSSFTTDMPLRALAYGVTANEYSLGVNHVWSNAATLGASYARQDFSDGNIRQRLLFNGNYTVYSAPDTEIALSPSVYSSMNTEDSVDYFSPKRDLAVNLVAQGERVLWRRYERSFGHRLVAGVGNYWQESHGSGLIAEVTYQQFFVIEPVVEVTYGLGWSRRIYDGAPENAWQATLNAVVRF